MLRDAVDGVIVGSALVRHLSEFASKPHKTVIDGIGAQVESLIDALN